MLYEETTSFLHLLKFHNEYQKDMWGFSLNQKKKKRSNKKPPQNNKSKQKNTFCFTDVHILIGRVAEVTF